ncbi:hypothetical protein J4558_10350 [Leptolyngbya sp. 15MV]|nr:hypothetical protein J4558_10350 [Leptolyngbya sp. 15MV]
MASKETRTGFEEEQSPIGGLVDDDEMFDMVNLSTRRTGVSGTIFISTRRASHGPRIKWFPGKAEWEAPCLIVTLETPPRAINQGLQSRIAREGQAIAVPWAERNRAALLRFWHDGLSWDSDEVQAFIDGLAKLP